MVSNNGNGKSLESWIWEAACSIRGARDAPKYKDYILPLIFTKRLCDVLSASHTRPSRRVCLVCHLKALRQDRRRGRAKCR